MTTEQPRTHDSLAEACILIEMAADALERERRRQIVAHLRPLSPFRVRGRGGRPIGERPDPAWLPEVDPRRGSASRRHRRASVLVPQQRGPSEVVTSGPLPRRSGRR